MDTAPLSEPLSRHAVRRSIRWTTGRYGSYLIDPAFRSAPGDLASCAGFTAGPSSTDWDGDGTSSPTLHGSTWRLAWMSTSPTVTYAGHLHKISRQQRCSVLLTSRSSGSPSLGTGNSCPPHIRRFRAVYLQSTVWKSRQRYHFHNPRRGLHRRVRHVQCHMHRQHRHATADGVHHSRTRRCPRPCEEPTLPVATAVSIPSRQSCSGKQPTRSSHQLALTHRAWFGAVSCRLPLRRAQGGHREGAATLSTPDR